MIQPLSDNPSASSGSELTIEQPAATTLANGSAATDFGTIPYEGHTSRTYTIRNSGTAPLTGLSLAVDGPHVDEFKVGSLDSTLLAPGASATFTVTFGPGAIGVHAATLHVSCGEPDVVPPTIALTGEISVFEFQDRGISIEITGCELGAVGPLTIPALINAKPVTSIRPRAFADFALTGRRKLRGLTIPASIAHVGTEAFTECSYLEHVEFLGNAPTMGDQVFHCWGYSSPPTRVGYHSHATGFTSPYWKGCKCGIVGD